MVDVLLISYYWPPAGGGGVQRWLKMSKYLHLHGIRLHVYTPSDGEFPGYDESLLKEVHPSIKVIKRPIWEPYKLFKFFTSKKEGHIYNAFINDKKQSWKEKLSVFLRGNFFIPDAKCFWIKPSIRFLNNYLKSNKIDVIISTGPPHSMHLIAYGIRKYYPTIRWIADFRDPWTMIDFYDKLMLTKLADYIHHRLEQNVLQKADVLVTISPGCAKDLEGLAKRQVKVINNGYDPMDFDVNLKINLTEKFTITHVGSMNSDRNPIVLWKVLSRLKSRIGEEFRENLSIVLIGNVDQSIKAAIIENDLEQELTHIPKLNHDDAILRMRESQMLLLPINNIPQQNGILPGKMYEYMGAGRPIIAFGLKESDASRMLQNSGSGKLFSYNNDQELERHLEQCFRLFLSKTLNVEADNYRQYGRDRLAEQYSLLIKASIEKS